MTSRVVCLEPGCPETFEGAPAQAEMWQRRHVGELKGGPAPGHASMLTTTP